MAKERGSDRPRRDVAGRPGTTRHRWAIDKLEEGTASIEHDGDRMFNVPRSIIPADAREGDVLDVRITTTVEAGNDAVTVDVRVDRAATTAASAASAQQVRRVATTDKGGDISL